MPDSDDVRDTLLPPWEDWQARTSAELAQRLQEQTAGSFAPDTPERARAVGLAVAVGNYEALAANPDQALMNAARARLQDLDNGRSRYWG